SGAGAARRRAGGRAQAAPEADTAAVPLAGPGAPAAAARRRFQLAAGGPSTSTSRCAATSGVPPRPVAQEAPAVPRALVRAGAAARRREREPPQRELRP